MDTVEVGTEHNIKFRLYQRMLLIYKASRLSIAVNLINGLIVLLVFWQVANISFIGVWFVSVTLVSSIRLFITFYVLKNSNDLNTRKWLNIFLIGTAINGAIWGAIVFAVPMTGGTELYFVCSVFMVAGMTSGATASASPYFPAGLAFNFPALLSIIAVFIMEGSSISYVMAGVIIFYGVALAQFGKSSERTTRALLKQKDIVQAQSSNINNQRQLIQEVLDTIGSGVAVYDENSQLTYWNKQFLTLLRVNEKWLNETKSLDGFINLIAAESVKNDSEVVDTIKRHLNLVQAERRLNEFEYAHARNDGKHFVIIGHPTEKGGVVFTYTDVTEQFLQIEEIKYNASHDSLTGLANRSVFQERLVEAVSLSKRLNTLVSVYYLDLDHFKNVNDTLGHPIGDELLKSVANRLLETVRDTDTVARLGGDEFAIIGTNHHDVDDVSKLADRILENLARPHKFDDVTITSGASVGVTIYPVDNVGPIEMASHADVALYRAKQLGRNQLAIFDEEMNNELTARKTTEMSLMMAVESGEFELFYQPKIDLKTRKVIGAEALIRWNHPERGMLTPDKFLEVAEKTQLIGKISEWVIGEAGAFLGRIEMKDPKKFTLSINLSASDFKNEGLKDIIWDALLANNVPAKMLEVEITESMVITDVVAAVKTLNQLKSTGISIAIDDFGVGYSSMTYLRDFSPDVLKIDRSFIMNCLDRPENLKIVEGIINLGHSLGMLIVAEGIEEEAHAVFLTDAECELGQGYHFGRPVPEEEFIRSYL